MNQFRYLYLFDSVRINIIIIKKSSAKPMKYFFSYALVAALAAA